MTDSSCFSVMTLVRNTRNMRFQIGYDTLSLLSHAAHDFFTSPFPYLVYTMMKAAKGASQD